MTTDTDEETNNGDDYYLTSGHENCFTEAIRLRAELEEARGLLVLEGHRCDILAEGKPCAESRSLQLGVLREPIEGYPEETHCLHVTTPAKSVVFGMNKADFWQLAVLCWMAIGSYPDQEWTERMAAMFAAPYLAKKGA